MKMEKLSIPVFCPLFSTYNHILRYLFDTMEKIYLTFRTTNNRKETIFGLKSEVFPIIVDS